VLQGEEVDNYEKYVWQIFLAVRREECVVAGDERSRYVRGQEKGRNCMILRYLDGS
jgi:hypothetical protein